MKSSTVRTTLALMLGGGLCGAAAAQQTLTPAQSVTDSLKSLRSGYQSVTGAAQTWSASLAVNGATASGSVSVSVSGSKYRYSAGGTLNTLASTQYEVAYDGTRYQLLDKSSGVLSYRAADSKPSPFGLPNPYMLMWEFLGQDNDTCESCALRPFDLDQKTVWDDRIGGMEVLSHDAATQTTVVTFPGGAINGADFEFMVTFVGPEAGQVPTFIDRVDANGDLISRTTLSNYTKFQGAGGSVVLPTAISVIGECQATDSVSISFALSAISLPGPSGLGTSAFTLDFAAATSVWDADANVFIKSP